MSLIEKGSSYGPLASLFRRFGSGRDQAVADRARPEQMQACHPALPATEMAVTTVSLYHLDQNIGFDNAGVRAGIDDQAINDLLESICDTEDRSGMHHVQLNWQSLYSAHCAPVASAEGQDTRAEPVEDADADQTLDNSDCEGTWSNTDIPAEEAHAALNLDAAPFETVADADETHAAPVAAVAGPEEIDAAPVEAEAGAAVADPALGETEAVAEGTGAAPTEESSTPEPAMSAAEDVHIVEVADFDPERDVIGVIYSKTIDAVTGKPVVPKVRISDNADGSGHIISLDGCDVAHVIGAKNLSEDQIELIGE